MNMEHVFENENYYQEMDGCEHSCMAKCKGCCAEIGCKSSCAEAHYQNKK